MKYSCEKGYHIFRAGLKVHHFSPDSGILELKCACKTNKSKP